jgi:glycosyltransferase involved in cell wall biosynthesis
MMIEPKKILMLLEGTFEEDERVQKSAISLAERGFEVHVLFPGAETRQYEFQQGVLCHCFEVNPTLFNKLLGTCLLHPFYFKLWERACKRQIKSLSSFKAIYIHDLPLSKLGVRLKERYGIRLICDQHEYYTDWIRQTQHMNTRIGKVVKWLSDWDAYEAKNLNKADLVVSVLEPLCELYREKHPSLRQKVINLPNTPAGRIYRDFKEDGNITGQFKSGKANRAIYIGAQLTRERRLDLMIDSIPTIVRALPDFRFMVLGREHRSYNIREHIERLGVGSHVELIGRVPFEEIPNYLLCSSVGINVHDLYAGKEVHESIFTKVYQYIGMHNAILSTELRAMAELIRTYDLGEVAESNPDSIAAAIISILGDPEKLERYVANTYKIENIFWEESCLPWLEKMEQILA